MKIHSTPEPLETRIALSASAILNALNAPAGTQAFDYSQLNEIAIGSNFGADGLIGFPTGPDDKFLIMSTGDATQITNPSYSKHGTDFLSKGEQGDFANIHLTVPVPANAKHLKFDFMFLTNEVPNADPTKTFNDYFEVDASNNINTTPGLLVGNNVNNAPYAVGASNGGTIFAHRTYLQTANYIVPRAPRRSVSTSTLPTKATARATPRCCWIICTSRRAPRPSISISKAARRARSRLAAR